MEVKVRKSANLNYLGLVLDPGESITIEYRPPIEYTESARQPAHYVLTGDQGPIKSFLNQYPNIKL